MYVHLDYTSLTYPTRLLAPFERTPMAAFTWLGPPAKQDMVNAGPLALILPLLDKLDIEAIIDRHLPPDPQREFSHGQVLRMLLAARLCQPTALVNVADWADKSGAAFFNNIPAGKLNDDRLGRALDAFFEHRHSILGSMTAQALQVTGLSMNRLHFDPTNLVLTGAYESSTPRPEYDKTKPFTGNNQLPAAHICHGYTSDRKMIQASQLAVVDELGALPVFAHILDGNRNGHPSIRETFHLAEHHLCFPQSMLMISDRGTCSIEHISRLYNHGYYALCAAQWQDHRSIYEANADRLNWQPASFLSIEQKRRRTAKSTLPQESYKIAVLNRELIDPTDKKKIPARILFVHSSADERECRERRQKNIAKIKTNLEAIQEKFLRGHPQCTEKSITRQVVKLLSNKEAGKYFTWQFVPLTVEEQNALPAPKSGHRRATKRLTFTLDSSAAEAKQRYDGLSVLVTTAPKTESADLLFSQYKQQNYVEMLHHQWKTPLAVTPVFLKSPSRIEALVCLLQIALQAYQVLERLYRKQVLDEEARSEKRMTTERMLRTFQVYGLYIERTPIGNVVHTTKLTERQKQILSRLGFPTPQEILRRILAPPPCC
jgi:transposase